MRSSGALNLFLERSVGGESCPSEMRVTPLVYGFYPWRSEMSKPSTEPSASSLRIPFRERPDDESSLLDSWRDPPSESGYMFGSRRHRDTSIGVRMECGSSARSEMDTQCHRGRSRVRTNQTETIFPQVLGVWKNMQRETWEAPYRSSTVAAPIGILLL